jgi:hypothetical protein
MSSNYFFIVQRQKRMDKEALKRMVNCSHKGSLLCLLCQTNGLCQSNSSHTSLPNEQESLEVA